MGDIWATQVVGKWLKMCHLNDQRGHNVMVKRGLAFVSPIMSREQQGQQQHGGRGPANGSEETICSMKLRL